MTDGLYRVTTNYLCAGFVIENGQITQCAPILRKKLAYWKTIAVKLSTPDSDSPWCSCPLGTCNPQPDRRCKNVRGPHKT